MYQSNSGVIIYRDYNIAYAYEGSRGVVVVLTFDSGSQTCGILSLKDYKIIKSATLMSDDDSDLKFGLQRINSSVFLTPVVL